MSLKNRFIPAGAGNSALTPTSSTCVAVYPRWRGELAGVNAVILFDGGLSPLARGTHRAPLGGVSHVRFIPAGAGNSE